MVVFFNVMREARQLLCVDGGMEDGACWMRWMGWMRGCSPPTADDRQEDFEWPTDKNSDVSRL